MKKVLNILIYSCIIVVVLYVLEQVLALPYLVKTVIKVPLFTLFPWLMSRRIIGLSIAYHIPKESRRLMALGMATVVLGILGAYVILGEFIDVKAITGDIGQRMQIGPQVIVIVALYTILVNSFVEEFFFRGFIFLGLSNLGYKKLGYMTSSVLFALYHITIVAAWFSLPMLFLTLMGLVIGGLIFAWFSDRTNSLVGSWLIHMSADAVIIGIGFFGIGLRS